MSSWLKENWFKAGILSLLLLVTIGGFFWYEVRPAIIRNECSWTVEHVPAITEITPDEAKTLQEQCLEEQKNQAPSGKFLDLFPPEMRLLLV